MSVSDRFSPEPLSGQASGYEEMRKGILQVWKFFRDSRLGLTSNPRISPDAMGIVLTLDPWFSMTRPLQAEITAQATVLARAQPDMLEEDLKPVLFCPVESMEGTLLYADEQTFLNAVRAARDSKYAGWMLESIHRTLTGKRPQKRYVFADRIGDVLPWWNDVTNLAAAQEGAASSIL